MFVNRGPWADASPTPEPGPQVDACPPQLLAMMQAVQNEVRKIGRVHCYWCGPCDNGVVAALSGNGTPEVVLRVSSISLMRLIGNLPRACLLSIGRFICIERDEAA